MLTVNRHFELLSEPEIQAAQDSLREEIVPEFRHLLGRVEGQLERMERREKGLVSRGELLGGRLEGLNEGKRKVAVPRRGTSAGGFAGGLGEAHGVGSRENVERMRQLKAKKERLMYTVERLALQKGQKVSLTGLDFWCVCVDLGLIDVCVAAASAAEDEYEL